MDREVRIRRFGEQWVSVQRLELKGGVAVDLDASVGGLKRGGQDGLIKGRNIRLDLWPVRGFCGRSKRVQR